MNAAALVTPNPWERLRRFTDARIALGRAGTSLPTEAHLAFQLAHARARDAVHHPLDVAALRSALADGMTPALAVFDTPLVSAAGDRPTYLQRPDLGRRLSTASRAALDAWASQGDGTVRHDLAFVVADGLSALAVERHAAPFLAAARPAIAGLDLAPITIVQQGRVAIGDEIGEALGAEIVVVLIGERPGLSSPDSLGLYLTWQPRIGLTDATRNCISNIRPGGLGFDEAAGKLAYLAGEARRRRLSGVALKDDTEAGTALGEAPATANFLLTGPAAGT